jgi:predicted amidophosphoribosyltransferase
MNPARTKLCPGCAREAELDSKVCETCGHEFRTIFSRLPEAEETSAGTPFWVWGLLGGLAVGAIAALAHHFPI